MRKHLAFAALLAGLLGLYPFRAGAQAPEVQPATHTEILEAVRQNGAQVTVLNIWATWCVPCIEEFPDLVKLGREFEREGVNVMFVSADFEEDLPAAQAFLKEHGVTETTFLKKGKDNAFVNGMHNEWSGALPATMVYNAQGQLVDFWEGKASYEEMKKRVLPHLTQ